MKQQHVPSVLTVYPLQKARLVMFSKNLSTSILRICDSRKLSYETAAELCGLSPRYFGSSRKVGESKSERIEKERDLIHT